MSFYSTDQNEPWSHGGQLDQSRRELQEGPSGKVRAEMKYTL